MNHADKVGNILLSSGIFLQYPTHNPAGETYYNPQILQIEGFHEKSDDMMIEADDASTPVVIPDRSSQSVPKPSLNPQDHVEQILDSLSHTNILQEIHTGTDRIKSTLMRQVSSSSGWEIFQHVLTKSEALERREARGGILADDMGLGKSLTMLSAIASSLQDAEAFAKEPPNVLTPSRATLIVVPSTSN
ncbi:unnamed protein product [Alternaria alternata]